MSFLGGDKSERTYFVRGQGKDIVCSFAFIFRRKFSGSWELVDILERSLEHTACFVWLGIILVYCFLLTGLALELVGKEGGLLLWGFRFLEGVFLFCSV